jgi:hypothetical protein|tara:strand:- start:266 stop:595 length:330 start_codon:yes stop_codon:yes gene_type:complete
MGYQLITGAVSCSLAPSKGSHYTGSFVKLLITGDAGDSETKIDRIEWGNLVEPESSFTPSGVITGSMTFPAGTVIDGPIARFKYAGTANNGGILAYYHKFISKTEDYDS